MDHKSYHHSTLSPVHETILGMIGQGADVLEIGCATGYMTKALHNRLGCHITAVEIDPAQAEQAKPEADKLIVGNICESETQNRVGSGFDYVIMADVLEHLPEPAEVLRWVKTIIGDKGSLIVSVPNVAYYKIRKQLLLGRWDYTDFGIMDNTHLRFFTEKTLKTMLTDNGYHIDELTRMFRGRADRILRPLCPDAFTYQFVVKASPA
jgi:2-polyprenyl-3-methyl-5-hydroxy-6-metoxy-1,4-benzoquinol methylase